MGVGIEKFVWTTRLLLLHEDTKEDDVRFSLSRCDDDSSRCGSCKFAHAARLGCMIDMLVAQTLHQRKIHNDTMNK